MPRCGPCVPVFIWNYFLDTLQLTVITEGAEYAISKGHRVRGMGRDPAKVPASIREKLEGFVTTSGIYDIPALDKAVSGVDAIVCAYGFSPEVVLEGQLLLLRAAERAGVKVNADSLDMWDA